MYTRVKLVTDVGSVTVQTDNDVTKEEYVTAIWVDDNEHDQRVVSVSYTPEHALQKHRQSVSRVLATAEFLKLTLIEQMVQSLYEYFK